MLVPASRGLLTTSEQKGSCGRGVGDAPRPRLPAQAPDGSHAPKADAGHGFGREGGSPHVGSSCCLWPKALGPFTPLSSTAQIPSTSRIRGGGGGLIISFFFYYTDWLHMPILGGSTLSEALHTPVAHLSKLGKARDLAVRCGQNHFGLGKLECLPDPWAGNALNREFHFSLRRKL